MWRDVGIWRFSLDRSDFLDRHVCTNWEYHVASTYFQCKTNGMRMISYNDYHAQTNIVSLSCNHNAMRF